MDYAMNAVLKHFMSQYLDNFASEPLELSPINGTITL
jgi:hypothetical protein